VLSPGGLSDANTTAVFRASGVNGARANYIYDNLEITRVTRLPWHMSAVARFDGQLASAELLPSEQLGAGGPSSVRGYNTRTVNGSQGALLSLELHSPSYSPLAHLGLPVADSGHLLAFYDAGFVSDLHVQQGQPRHATLQSVGIGARYSIDRYLDLRFDYGWQLTKAPGATSTGNLASVSVTLSY
jgi:hemolysin activation/secretion protein